MKLDHGSTWYKGYNHAIGGNLIHDFVKAAGKYSGYDVAAMLLEIEKKQAWFYENNPDRANSFSLPEPEVTKPEHTLAKDFGRRLPYRGGNYILGGGIEKKPFFSNCFCVPVSHTSEQIKCDVEKIYRDLAQKDLTEKVQEYAAKLGVETPAFKLSGAKTVLGRCSKNKNITFSWRLVMGKDKTIDYVVVATLVQFVYPKYAPEYWALIKKTMPDYENRQYHLRYFIEHLKDEEWL